MRVVLIGNVRAPIRQPFPGGLESMSWHLAKGLRAAGLEVEMYAGPGSDPTAGVHELPLEPFELSETARRDANMPPEAHIAEHFAYQDLMLHLQTRTDVDVIHNNSLHYLPVAMAPTLPVPMVTTLHTPPTPWLEPTVKRLRDRRAQFVAVSNNTGQRWSAVVDSTVVHNGIDTDAWKFGPGGRNLVWFGRLVPEKAPHHAIEIASLVNMPLVLAGPIGDRAYFDEQIKPRLNRNVRYAGHLATRDLARLVARSAVCLVTPHWDEPFGLVAAEAMSCGTPALVFNRGGLPEVVSKGGGVAVDSEDVVGAIVGIRQLLTLDRRTVRTIAQRRFSLARMVRDYTEVYEATATMTRAA